MSNENVVHIHYGIPLNHKEKENHELSGKLAELESVR